MTKKHTSKSKNDFVALAFYVLAMAVGGGWFGEGLSPLFEFEPLSPGTTLFGLFFFFFGAWHLYEARHKFLPVRVISQSERIKPRRVLIIPVSPPNNPWREISTDLESALENDQKAEKKLNWLQILRTIKPHLSTLEEIHLIGFSGDTPSYEKLGECTEFIQRYFKNVRIKCYPKPVPFEDLGALIHTVNAIIDDITQRSENPIDRKDIMLDTTGSTKTVSIAMAMVTTRDPTLQFQYVTTGNDPHPIAFNVVTESQVELG